MQKIESPYFTLMTKFTSVHGKNISSYLEYMGREDAKEQLNFSNFESSDGYFDYMNRDKAKQMENKISKNELNEFIKTANESTKKMIDNMKKEPSKPSFLKTGMFDKNNNDLSINEFEEYQKQFNTYQKKGNILYQDVLSFKTIGLIEAGIYNPFNGNLNRDVLIDASRKMMSKMIVDEKLDPKTMFVGQIHYNTKQFHIHFACMEQNNTREVIDYRGNIEFKGKRKQSTLDNMKSTFVNQIFDRTDKLKEISDLRNSLRYSVKKEMKQAIKYNLLIKSELKKIQKQLPKNLSNWNMKYLNTTTQKQIYKFIDKLMKNDSEFKSYMNKVEEENIFKQKMYGQLQENQQSFLYGRLYGNDGIYYRLGNSILEDLKKKKYNEINKNKHTKKIDDKQKSYYNKSKLSSLKKVQQNLKNITYIMNNSYMDSEKYKAKMQHEQMLQEAEYKLQTGNSDLEL